MDSPRRNDFNANRCLVIPDIHHRNGLVAEIRQRHSELPVVFLGDYFDDFGDGPFDIRQTCARVAQALEDDRDCFLLGNHCFAYLAYDLGVLWGRCAGWTLAKQLVFHEYFPGDTLLRRTNWLVWVQGWLLSHAGITNELYRRFAKRRTEEEICQWAEDAESAFRAGVADPALVAGRDRGGQYPHGGLLWCDWNSFRPVPGVRQIFGHTIGSDVREKSGSFCLDTNLRSYEILDSGNLETMPGAQ